MINSIQRKSRLTIKSGDIISINPVLFEEYHDEVEEMGEKDKGNQQ
jgi:hypothetical protein